jgi:hypothetical protein
MRLVKNRLKNDVIICDLMQDEHRYFFNEYAN